MGRVELPFDRYYEQFAVCAGGGDRTREPLLYEWSALTNWATPANCKKRALATWVTRYVSRLRSFAVHGSAFYSNRWTTSAYTSNFNRLNQEKPVFRLVFLYILRPSTSLGVTQFHSVQLLVAGVRFELTTSWLCVPLQFSLLPHQKMNEEFLVWTVPWPE